MIRVRVRKDILEREENPPTSDGHLPTWLLKKEFSAINIETDSEFNLRIFFARLFYDVCSIDFEEVSKMHLIARGLLEEFKEELEERDGYMVAEDIAWWTGYAMGLRTAGSITQDEHDDLVTQMSEMSTEEEPKKLSPEGKKELFEFLEGR